MKKNIKKRIKEDTRIKLLIFLIPFAIASLLAFVAFLELIFSGELYFNI